jgi:hypothetical protein
MLLLLLPLLWLLQQGSHTSIKNHIPCALVDTQLLLVTVSAHIAAGGAAAAADMVLQVDGS